MVKEGFWVNLFKKPKVSIEDELVLIRKRLGWIIFWLFVITYILVSGLGGLASLLE